jgi:hypothetical protein
MPDGGGAGEEIDSASGSVLRWRIEAFQNAFDLRCERGKFVLQDVFEGSLIVPGHRWFPPECGRATGA